MSDKKEFECPVSRCRTINGQCMFTGREKDCIHLIIYQDGLKKAVEILEARYKKYMKNRATITAGHWKIAIELIQQEIERV
jgi:hypothetical protein